LEEAEKRKRLPERYGIPVQLPTQPLLLTSLAIASLPLI